LDFDYVFYFSNWSILTVILASIEAPTRVLKEIDEGNGYILLQNCIN